MILLWFCLWKQGSFDDSDRRHASNSLIRVNILKRGQEYIHSVLHQIGFYVSGSLKHGDKRSRHASFSNTAQVILGGKMTNGVNSLDNFHPFDEERVVSHQANCQKEIKAILEELNALVQDSKLPQARRDWLTQGLVHIRGHIEAETRELLSARKYRVN